LEIGVVVTIFLCVLLHELGHALTAKLFKIDTRDIVLYPFGGIASLTEQPRAKAELIIALAGPLVNVAIVVLGLPFVDGTIFQIAASDSNLGEIVVSPWQYYLTNVLLTNIGLVIFNMIPAIPMDGGRVLRSALTIFKVKKATLISCRVSQILSAIMGACALYYENPILLLISTLVFSNSFREMFHEQAQVTLTNQSARDFMTDASHLQTLTHGVTVKDALKPALRSLQNAFPVLHGEQVLGLIDKDSLLKAAATDEEEQYVSGLMERNFPNTTADSCLAEIVQKLENSQGLPLVVLEKGRLVGMIFKDRLLDFLMLEGLLKSRQNPQN